MLKGTSVNSVLWTECCRMRQTWASDSKPRCFSIRSRRVPWGLSGFKNAPRLFYWVTKPYSMPGLGQRYKGSMHAYVLSRFSHVQLFVTPRTVAARLLCPWDSPGKNTRVGSHALLQGIFPTQGLSPGLLQLLQCRWILYHWATEKAHIFNITLDLWHLSVIYSILFNATLKCHKPSLKLHPTLTKTPSKQPGTPN